MRAARFHGRDEGLRVEEVPKPDVGPGEVLVEIEGAGLCHSDLHVLDGTLPLPRTPVTLGHENAGTVAAVGEGVERVDVGTPVAVFGGWGCGQCRVCARGDDQLCDLTRWVGIGRDGGFAEYLRVPEPRYLRELEGLDPVAAAPLTDAGVTSYRAVHEASAELTPGDVLAIVGIGGLGEFAVQLADEMTGADVLAADVDPDALDRAAALGADATVDLRERRLPRAARSLTDGAGAGAVVDLVGTDETLQGGLNALRTAGRLVVAGIGGGSVPFGWNPLNPAEVTLTTVQWGSPADLDAVLALARAGTVEGRVETVGFDGLADAIDRLEAGAVEGRVVLTPSA